MFTDNMLVEHPMLTREKTKHLPVVYEEISLEEHKKHYKFDPNNPWGRMHNPEKVGHLLVCKSLENKENIQQIEITKDPILFRPLIVDSVGGFETPKKTQGLRHKISAHTPNGTKMTSERSVNISNGSNQSTLLFFSPERKMPIDSRVHAKRKIEELSLDSNDGDGMEKYLSARNPETPRALVKIGGLDKVVTPPILRNRKLENAKSNKSTMKRSAEQALLEYIDNQKDKIDSKQLELLKLLTSCFKIEWLHRLAYSLCPKEFDPQTRENLGSGPKWINTYMMVLENLAKHFSVLYPGMVTVEPVFFMLPDSDVIDKIEYSVTINRDNQSYTVSNSISVLELPERSNWPSTTDSQQIIQVLTALMDQEDEQQNPDNCPKKIRL